MTKKKSREVQILKRAVNRANKQAQKLDDDLCVCQDELRRMTNRKDILLNSVQSLEADKLRLLEDYHDLASDVLLEQKSKNYCSVVGKTEDE